MSSILDKIEAAHDGRGLNKVALPAYPEIGHFYFTPLTMMQEQNIKRRARKGDDADLQAEWLIECALDADGKRIFDLPPAERPRMKKLLQNFDSTTMRRINMESDGSISQDGAAECVDLVEGQADFREKLAALFSEYEKPLLAEAAAAIDGAMMARALCDIRAAFEAGAIAKND